MDVLWAIVQSRTRIGVLRSQKRIERFSIEIVWDGEASLVLLTDTPLRFFSSTNPDEKYNIAVASLLPKDVIVVLKHLVRRRV